MEIETEKNKHCEVRVVLARAMVVAIPFRYDLWSTSDPVKEQDPIDVHCFFPNGIYINFKVKQNITIIEFKEVGIEWMNHCKYESKEKHKKVKNKCVITFVFLFLSFYGCSNFYL